MFQSIASLVLPITAIATTASTYKINSKVLGATGVKGLILNLGVGVLSISQTFNLVKDSAEVMRDKETFGSAAVFATNVLVANICTNYLTYKVIKMSDLNNAVTLISKIQGVATFLVGFSIARTILDVASQNIVSVGDILFNKGETYVKKDETYAEFENSGKLKKALYSLASSIISYNFAQIFTKIADIADVEGDLIKLGLATIFAPMVFSVLYTDNTLKVSGDTNSKIDELGHDGE